MTSSHESRRDEKTMLLRFIRLEGSEEETDIGRVSKIILSVIARLGASAVFFLLPNFFFGSYSCQYK